ncbi:unnamed protein product, partial [Ectocarpus sp. 13 AM-2016]
AKWGLLSAGHEHPFSQKLPGRRQAEACYHRTHKLFCVEIGLPLGLNELGPSVLFLILGMHYLGIAGCNASS